MDVVALSYGARLYATELHHRAEAHHRRQLLAKAFVSWLERHMDDDDNTDEDDDMDDDDLIISYNDQGLIRFTQSERTGGRTFEQGTHFSESF